MVWQLRVTSLALLLCWSTNSLSQLELMSDQQLHQAIDKERTLSKPKVVDEANPTIITYADGVREACRSQMAGLYTSLIAEAHQSAAYISSLKQKLSGLSELIPKMQKQISDREDLYTNESFDLPTEQLIAGLKQKLNVAQASQKFFAAELAKYEALHKQTMTKKDTINQLLTPVFTIKQTQSKTGYGLQFGYRSHCDKYQWICPLPQSERQQLAAAAVTIAKLTNQSHIDPCDKYAQMLPIKAP